LIEKEFRHYVNINSATPDQDEDTGYRYYSESDLEKILF
jgi:DNA-binding transcriptional MerR regulator